MFVVLLVVLVAVVVAVVVVGRGLRGPWCVVCVCGLLIGGNETRAKRPRRTMFVTRKKAKRKVDVAVGSVLCTYVKYMCFIQTFVAMPALPTNR